MAGFEGGETERPNRTAWLGTTRLSLTEWPCNQVRPHHAIGKNPTIIDEPPPDLLAPSGVHPGGSAGIQNRVNGSTNLPSLRYVAWTLGTTSLLSLAGGRLHSHCKADGLIDVILFELGFVGSVAYSLQACDDSRQGPAVVDLEGTAGAVERGAAT